MRLKDYYRTLGVTAAASAADIRKAFRQLAFKYHPDKNPESPFAAGHFRELQEAYQVLGDAARRARYDEERWLLGMGQHRPGAGRLTPEWIGGEARKLRLHMERIDTYRMNHDALQAYVLLLLSDEHLAVLKESGVAAVFAADVLTAVGKLRPALLAPVLERLRLLAGDDELLNSRIDRMVQAQRQARQEERAFPWMVVLTILIIIAIALITGTRSH